MKIILISGWGFPASCWNAVRHQLVGLPMSIQTVSWEDWLTMGAALLAAEHDRVILIGWSLGGMLALQSAIAHPHKVAACMMISSTARYTADVDYPGVDPRSLAQLRKQIARTTEPALTAFADSCAAPQSADSWRDSFLESAMALGPKALDTGLEILATADLRTAAAGLACPLRLLHGDADQVVPMASAQWLTDVAPCCGFERLSGTGHDLPLSHPRAVARSIRSFVDALVHG